MGVVVDWLGKSATAPEPPPAHSTPTLIIADTLPRLRLYPEIPKHFEAALTSRGVQIPEKRDRSAERKHREDQESINFELDENLRKDKALRCHDPGPQYDNTKLNWESELEPNRMTSRRVPTLWLPELKIPRLNSWEQSMIGRCKEEESTVPVAGLSLQDIIPQRESGESTECFLTRCIEAGVGAQLLDSPGGKAILRSRGAVIPKGVKPSDIVYNQGGTLGEDNMDSVVTKLISQVRKGELGLQLAMRSLRNKPECREFYEERLIQEVPVRRELSAKWNFLTVGEKPQAPSSS